MVQYSFIQNLGHVNFTEFLIENGADVNVKNDNGLTALDLAESNGICLYFHFTS